jgi:hypothetical protein
MFYTRLKYLAGGAHDPTAFIIQDICANLANVYTEALI